MAAWLVILIAIAALAVGLSVAGIVILIRAFAAIDKADEETMAEWRELSRARRPGERDG